MSAIRMRLAATCVATAACAMMVVEGSAHEGGLEAATTPVQTAPRAAAGEQVVIDFQSLEVEDDAIHDWGHSYEEESYVVSNPVQDETLRTVGTLNSRYPGSTAMFNSQSGGVVTVDRADGEAFDAFSIKLANFNPSGRAIVNFVGNQVGGSTVETTFMVSEENENQIVLEEFFFDGFTNLLSLEWTQEPNLFHQFDDITVTSDSVDVCGNCPCPADTNRNGNVDFDDILLWLDSWGSCPPAPRGGGGSPLWGLTSASPAELYRIDMVTGVATLHPVPVDGNANFAGLTFLNGTIYGSDLFGFEGESFTIDTGTIDPETGTITFVSDQDGSLDWQGLAANEGAGVLYAIDLDVSGFPLKTLAPDGTVGTVGPTDVDGRGLAYDDTSGVLYATNSATDTIHRINTQTGEADEGLPLGLDIGTRVGLAFDEATGILYMNAASTRRLYTVDVETGAATEVGSNAVAVNIDGLAWFGTVDQCGSCPCPADINRDMEVDFDDLLPILSLWGPCP